MPLHGCLPFLVAFHQPGRTRRFPKRAPGLAFTALARLGGGASVFPAGCRGATAPPYHRAQTRIPHRRPTRNRARRIGGLVQENT